MTHTLHVLNHSTVDHVRFTGLIAHALLKQCPALQMQEHMGGGQGAWQLGEATCQGLLDDVFVVESQKTGCFKVVDFQDSYTMAHGLSYSPLFRGAAVMMFHPPSVQALYGAQSHLIVPGWFLDQSPLLTRSYRERVQEIRSDWNSLDPRLYFRGTIHGETPNSIYLREGKSVREVALVLRAKYPDEVDISGFKEYREDWFLTAAAHQIVLTLPGHPWCYREHEMMSLGIPILTYRWTSHLYHQPIHYFPVEGVPQDQIGFAVDPEQGADAIIAKFRQVRGNQGLAESVGRRAQRWYDQYLTPEAIARDMLTWLDLESL